MRQLCRKIYLVPAAVFLQDFPDGRFAARIDVSGVEIIDAQTDRVHQFPLRFFQINSCAFPGKTHTAVAQYGQVVSSAVFSVLHRFSSPFLRRAPAYFASPDIRSNSSIQIRAHASDGILRSPLGESATEPTFGPSGRQERLNCWAKNLR